MKKNEWLLCPNCNNKTRIKNRKGDKTMSNSIKDSAQAFAVNQVLKYVDSNPQEAFPKLLDWADKFDKDNLYLPYGFAGAV